MFSNIIYSFKIIIIIIIIIIIKGKMPQKSPMLGHLCHLVP
ncbi:hypothetical protein ACMBCN_02460 [Candidatus Liberibacter asiaticus]|nr:hypothetical protein [Candidatus Regiella insecticola]MCZ8632196.1 hypothetical protein [Spiroplasma sp. Tabriz.8]